MKIKDCFPCLEQPQRCYLSMKQNKRLSCNPEGNIFCTDNRHECEEWYILEDPNSGFIQFKNCTHGTFLSCNTLGAVSATKDGHEKWMIQRDDDPKNGDGNLFSICSVISDRYLTCQENGVICGIKRKEDTSACTPSWRIQFLTGELCFISSPHNARQISCHPWSGYLTMSKNWKGWEVWRFIEAGDGHVRIVSWHDNHFLCSDDNGKVWTTQNIEGEWEKWVVELADDYKSGVVFKSVSHGRYLQIENNGKRFSTCAFMKGKPCTWHIAAANRQEFFLSSPVYDRRIGSNKSDITCTSNRKSWEAWELHCQDGGFVSFRSKKFGKNLCSDQDGNLYQTDFVGENALWKIGTSPTNSIYILSKTSGKYLSYDDRGERFLTHFGNQQPEAFKVWSLEPVLPSTTTGTKMRNLTIGGSMAAISIIAAPFAVVGAVGAMGFGSAGVAGGSMAAGMMSAEAIASGGAIAAGGTVATLQSIGAAGLGVAGTAASMSAGAVVGASTLGVSAIASKGRSSMGESTMATATGLNRPFCAWTSW